MVFVDDGDRSESGCVFRASRSQRRAEAGVRLPRHVLVRRRPQIREGRAAEAVKTALQTFRDGNPAMISVGGIGGADSKGKGGIGLRPATNPFAKKTFNLTEQIKLQMEQPELAKTLAAEAASQG